MTKARGNQQLGGTFMAMMVFSHSSWKAVPADKEPKAAGFFLPLLFCENALWASHCLSGNVLFFPSYCI